jgi:ribokinase
MREPIKSRIAVCGSINMDLVLRCDRLPKPGQTLTAHDLTEVCGGKGANQAVAAVRAGGHVEMVGCIGTDSYGATLLENLIQEKINCSHVTTAPDCNSGLAFIAVEASGQNSILIVPGANARLSDVDITRSQPAIQAADCLLLQLEVPTATVLAAIRMARQSRTRVILNPAPVPPDWTDELLQVDLVCPNELEAEQIVGFPLHTLAAIERAAHVLHERGAGHVCITLGERGVGALVNGQFQLHPALPITAIDTTAAGDAFLGALAVRWVETDDLRSSLPFAIAAGALAVSRSGAQPSLPTRADIEQLLG